MKRKIIIFHLIVLACLIIIGFLSRQRAPQQTAEVTHIFDTRTYLKPTEASYNPQTPTLESVFAEDHSWTATLSTERKKTLLATGDVMTARDVNIQATKFQNFTWPFEKVMYVLSEADITFINLETPLVEDCPLIDSGFTFCGNVKHVEGFIAAGIDVANIANNHTGNFGQEGILTTVSTLRNNGILVSGYDGPTYKTINGTTFAFLGYNDVGYEQKGIAWAHEATIQKDINDAQKYADIIVVAFHWGDEYQALPNERQKKLGRFAIDVGADIIIGNHPHWMQPFEIYKDKMIMYSHGNFIFDQEWSLKTKQGVVGKYTFYDNILIDVEFLPVLIENYGQPSFLESNEKRNILEEMKKNTEELKMSVE